jgi:hypothetical protein
MAAQSRWLRNRPSGETTIHRRSPSSPQYFTRAQGGEKLAIDLTGKIFSEATRIHLLCEVAAQEINGGKSIFFSEEKKQKTFISGARGKIQAMASMFGVAQT